MGLENLTMNNFQKKKMVAYTVLQFADFSENQHITNFIKEGWILTQSFNSSNFSQAFVKYK